MKPFVDQHRERFGVEPICKILQIAPSGYRREVARQRDPLLRPASRCYKSSATRHWCPKSNGCGTTT